MVDETRPPKIENAPGLVWKKHKHRWEARWQCRTDLRQKGFRPAVVPCWIGLIEELNETHIAHIQATCTSTQNEMLVWGKGGVPEIVVPFDGTLRSLIDSYKLDPMSSYNKKLRFVSKRNYNSLMGIIDKSMGLRRLSEIKGRSIQEQYDKWAADGKIAISHSLITMLRTLVSYGFAMLEDEQCKRLSDILSEMRFENAKRRSVVITEEQFDAHCARAHVDGWHSVALTNTFQWDCMLRQKDVIGEYIPISEKDFLSDVIVGNNKWGRGLQWQEIDDDLVLRHVTSKRQKPVVIHLRMAPHVMAEFARIAGVPADELRRDMLPKGGPVVAHDQTGAPWHANDYRWRWRQEANRVGIPKNVRSMDHRASGISDAITKGASLEHVRHAATHSDISTTQGYDRAQENNTITVMQKRFGNKSGT